MSRNGLGIENWLLDIVCFLVIGYFNSGSILKLELFGNFLEGGFSMHIIQEQLSPGKHRLTITVPEEGYESHLRDTAFELGAKMAIPGFRPGKVPYAILKARIGAMELLAKSVNAIVERGYLAALKEKNLRAALPPKITVSKLCDGNPVEFIAEVVSLPGVVLSDFSKIKLNRKAVSVGEKDVSDAIQELQKRRAVEALKDGAINDGDKVEFDIESAFSEDKEHKETARNQTVIIGETPLVSEFAEHCKGLKAGEIKTFTLEFPRTYHKKEYAEKEAEFTLHINKVWERQIPVADDSFARSVNKRFADLSVLKKELEKNILLERAEVEEKRLERQALEKALSASRYEEIAGELIIALGERLFQEFPEQLNRVGISMEDYLQNANKTPEEVKKDMEIEAIRNIRMDALVSEVIAQAGLTVPEQEIEQEANAVLRQYPSLAKAKRETDLPSLIARIQGDLLYKKAVGYIKSKVIIK